MTTARAVGVCFRDEAEVGRKARPADSVENGAKRTPAIAALESGAYAQRAAGEQDAAIRTARNAPMRIEEHIDANE